MQENPHTCLNRNWKESDAFHLKFPQAKRVSPVILIRGCDQDRPRNFLTEIRVEPSGGTKPGMHAEAAQSCPVGSTSLSCPCPSQTPRLLSPRSRGQALRTRGCVRGAHALCVCVCDLPGQVPPPRSSAKWASWRHIPEGCARGASEATRGERAPHAPGTGRPLSEPSCAPVSLPESGEPRGSAPWVLRLLPPGRVPLTSLGDCPPLFSTASPEAGLVLRRG